MKKISKIIVAVTMALIFSVGLLGSGFSVQAEAATINISNKGIILKEGKTKTITIKKKENNTKWKSSNTAIAKVNEKGKVTAKKVGLTIVTATTKKSKYIYFVRVIKKSSTNPVTTVTPTIKPVATAEPVVTAVPTVKPVVTVAPTVKPVVTAAPTVKPVVTVAPTVKPVVTATPTPSNNSATGKVEEATASDFDAKVLKAQTLVVVDFWASWCQPCMRLKPYFSDLAKEYTGSVKFVSVDNDKASSLANKYSVTTLPTLVFFKNGKEVYRQTGGFGTASGDADRYISSLKQKINSYK